MADSVAITGSVGRPQPHESAHLHVSGRAMYCDDIALPSNTLHAAFGVSGIAHGHVRGIDLTCVTRADGVIAVVGARDIPGENNYGGVVQDDPIFAEEIVQYVGQPLFAVAATSYTAARKAARLARVDYAPLPPILDARAAIAAGSFVLPSQHILRGRPREIIASSTHRLSGTVVIGGQDHFYLEGQIAIAVPQEDGTMLVHSSTQHPTEVQHIVAHALKRRAHDITVQCRRMGGGFGGKESQPALIAAAAAVLAHKTRRPVKLRLDRDDDMIITGKRHDFLADYDVGFDSNGRILGVSIMLASRCGYSADLSGPVNDRAMCHLDNAYYLDHVEVTSHRCKTNTVSNTAFRGFGGPQGMMVIEQILDDIARTLGIDPLDVRRSNLYGQGERNVTPYGQVVEHDLSSSIIEHLAVQCRYAARREEITAWNRENTIIKRGLALTPVKFGISFNATLYNQAGALVNVYTDGTILLNHGGTEMGQGLFTKVAQIVAHEFGLPLASVRVSATDTAKVPNTSPTAASSGSDLNGKAAQAAARAIKDRLIEWACSTDSVPVEDVRFADGQVHVGKRSIAFGEFARQAHAARISLSSTGYYRTPKIHWDRAAFNGRPFFYFAYGAAVTEVAIDTLTGETKLLRVDILHDAGSSLNPAIDLGQIEGGYLQGVGWLTSEELWWDAKGGLKTHAPSTYKIPTARDWPDVFNIEFFDVANREDTIFRSKAVGEPPLMLAISAFHAIRDAVASCSSARALPKLSAPATPESVLRAITSIRESTA